MKDFTEKFREFAKERMEAQGEEIRKWVKLDNPLLSTICSEIIEAAGEKE